MFYLSGSREKECGVEGVSGDEVRRGVVVKMDGRARKLEA